MLLFQRKMSKCLLHRDQPQIPVWNLGGGGGGKISSSSLFSVLACIACTCTYILVCVFSPIPTGIRSQEKGEWVLSCNQHHTEVTDSLQRSERNILHNVQHDYFFFSFFFLLFFFKAASYLAPQHGSITAWVYPLPPSPPPPSLATTVSSSSRPSSLDSVPLPPSPPPNSAQTNSSFSPASVFLI